MHCLTPGDEPPSPNSDIDIFLHSMDENQARIKIYQLYQKFASSFAVQKSKQSIVVLRTVHTLTFVHPYPIPHCQIILRLHADKAEVITAFDIDCCGVYFDGAQVVATNRCVRALNTHCNVSNILFVHCRKDYSKLPKIV